MRAFLLLFFVLAGVLLLGGFNALEGPAAIVVAIIAATLLIAALVGGLFLRPRSGPH
jgi:putative effector of murein hydrolase LrgA (UPF0299 family)